jgi:hypothetical protein
MERALLRHLWKLLSILGFLALLWESSPARAAQPPERLPLSVEWRREGEATESASTTARVTAAQDAPLPVLLRGVRSSAEVEVQRGPNGSQVRIVVFEDGRPMAVTSFDLGREKTQVARVWGSGRTYVVRLCLEALAGNGRNLAMQP